MSNNTQSNCIQLAYYESSGNNSIELCSTYYSYTDLISLNTTDLNKLKSKLVLLVVAVKHFFFLKHNFLSTFTVETPIVLSKPDLYDTTVFTQRLLTSC